MKGASGVRFGDQLELAREVGGLGLCVRSAFGTPNVSGCERGRRSADCPGCGVAWAGLASSAAQGQSLFAVGVCQCLVLDLGHKSSLQCQQPRCMRLCTQARD